MTAKQAAISERGKSLPVLTTERSLLRLPVVKDIDNIIYFYEKNASYLGKYSPAVKEEFLDKEFWLRRVGDIQKDFEEDRGCGFFIFKKNAGDVLGYINFFNFVRGALHGCILGYGLAEHAQGQGLMTEGLRVAISFAMQDLNLHRIEANYHPDNIRSAKILERLGFTIEGKASHYLRINNEWQPHIRTSLTNHNWRADGQFV